MPEDRVVILLYIVIETAPNKKTYHAGETFDPDGMQVRAYYQNGTNNLVTAYSFSPATGLTVNDTQVVITFFGKTATQSITVLPAALSYLTINNPPFKTDYFVGESFNPDGMVVYGVKTDHTSFSINNYSYSPTGPLSLNDGSILITYQGKTVAQSILVSNPSSIGYFGNQYSKNGTIGENPIYCLADLSIRYITNPIVVNNDSFKLSLSIIYHSRMKELLSKNVLGLPRLFKTNFHQFMIQDGVDNCNNPLFKYIDADDYVHTFKQITSNLYHDTEGLGLIYNSTNRIIVDETKNKLSFDAYGRLISIQSGLDDDDEKIIQYTNGYITRIYDARESGTYFDFVYQSNRLTYLRVYYLNSNNPIKTYSLSYVDNRLFSINETVNNNTRELYKFSYSNQFLLNTIFDNMGDKAYCFSYVFNSVLNDYCFSSYQIGHVEYGLFVEDEEIEVDSINYNLSPVSINEIVLSNNNGITLSYMIDKKDHIVSTFEKTSGSSTNYYSLTKETGSWVSFQGNSGVLINNSRQYSVSGQVTINQGLDSNAFNGEKNLCLKLYAKIGNSSQRIRVLLSANDIESSPTDISPYAYGVWQLIEIPFKRLVSNNQPIAFTSFTLSFSDENNTSINIEIANLIFDKCRPQKLFFDSGSLEFSSIGQIKLYNAQTQQYEIINQNGVTYMTPNDLLRTLLSYCSNYGLPNSPHFAYFNDGSTIKKWDTYLKVILGDSIEITLIDETSISFDGAISACINGLFFAYADGVYPRTYYYFYENYYEISYVEEKHNGGIIYYETDTKRYNYLNQLIKHIEKRGGETNYEYFSNGKIKKETAVYALPNNTLHTAVLFEAIQDNANKHVIRTINGKECQDYEYTNDLLTKTKINHLSQNVWENSPFFTNYSYDTYLNYPSSVLFMNTGTTQEQHNYASDISNRTISIEDSVSKFQLVRSLNRKTLTLKAHNGINYAEVFSVNKTSNTKTINYNCSYNGVTSNQSIVYTYNDYSLLTSIVMNNVVKASFIYETGSESDGCALLTSVTDYFTNQTTSFEYDEISKEITKIQTDSFCVEYEKDGQEIYHTRISFNEIENYLLIESDTQSSVSLYDEFSVTYQFDSYERTTSKQRTINQTTMNESFTYCDNYPFLISGFSLNYGNYTYHESYIYDNSHNFLDEIDIALTPNDIYEIHYQYDGFGRLLSETNELLNINRIYMYKEDSIIPGPVGRMVKFGNDEIEYDDFGRIVVFGNNTYSYDAYGNRKSKNQIVTYNWERGHLLSSVGQSSFTYDYQEKRVSKIDSSSKTHSYFYNGSQLIAENITSPLIINNIYLRFFYDKTGLTGFIKIENGISKKYVYIKNAFKDIIGIIEGNIVVARYVYDAWGNHCVYDQYGQIDASSTSIGNINPFRYRSYYFDRDTGLYYLNYRYYDPEIGHFISPDSIEYLKLNSLQGIHLYAYCAYNPITNYDYSGHLFLSLFLLALSFPMSPIGGASIQLLFSVSCYAFGVIASIFNDSIREDMIGISYNPFNMDAERVVSSNVLSFYKGIPVFLIDTKEKRSFTFGAVFLQRGHSASALKHEYGHAFQQFILGPAGYALWVVIPSAGKWGIEDNDKYYEKPWETIASFIGGDYDNEYSAGDIVASFFHLFVAYYFGPFSYFFAFWGGK